jgi:hypothetical protein
MTHTPTHGQTDAFIRKWNKMFAIKGYSKMGIKEKNAMIEKKVNDLVKQSSEHKKIKEEWERVKVTKPPPAPKRAPKKAGPKPPTKKETKQKLATEVGKLRDLISKPSASTPVKGVPKGGIMERKIKEKLAQKEANVKLVSDIVASNRKKAQEAKSKPSRPPRGNVIKQEEKPTPAIPIRLETYYIKVIGKKKADKIIELSGKDKWELYKKAGEAYYLRKKMTPVDAKENFIWKARSAYDDFTKGKERKLK